MCNAMTKAGKKCQWRGSVCPNHHTGGSVMSTIMAPVYAISNRVWGVAEGPRKKETARFRDFLNQHQGQKIVGLKEGRQPVNGAVKAAVNGLSFGKLKKKQKELGYEDVYHDFIIAELDDGSRWRIEKDHVVKNSKAKASDYQWVSDIPLNGKEVDLTTLFANAAKNDPDFWKYRAAKDNCQKFANDVVEKNGFVPEGTMYRQDAKALVDTVVGGETIPNAITDTAGRLDRLVYGDGAKAKKSKVGKGSRTMLLQHL